jgi:[protein-PII] uridylyltransferase
MNPLQELRRRAPSIPSRFRGFKVPTRVLIDNKASADHTVVEVNGRDRPGLLYQVTLALSQLKLTIRSARIATFGEHAVDVFYLQDTEGKKIESKRRLQTLEARVLDALKEETPVLADAPAVTRRSRAASAARTPPGGGRGGGRDSKPKKQDVPVE